ncbi:MAG TPA: hypothetical protein PKD37_04040 [Oligoflexia bacterium]|nr:hypothetical protein [Oligoflexia bacterium]HMP27137.1 hypothetical protein [Oligoflexia bacterium]
MLIKCPNCKTNFNFSPAQEVIGKEIIFLCSKCNYSFKKLVKPATQDFAHTKLQISADLANAISINQPDYPIASIDQLSNSDFKQTSTNLDFHSSKQAPSELNKSLYISADAFENLQEKIEDLEWSSPLGSSPQTQNDTPFAENKKQEKNPIKNKPTNKQPKPFFRFQTNTNQENKSSVIIKQDQRSISLSIVVPLLLYVFALMLLSIITIFNQNLLTEMLASVGFRLPRSQPAGVLVENIEVAPVKLDNGLNMPAITGQIANYSAQPVINPLIEGIFYGKGGVISQRSQAYLDSRLTNAKVESLNPETIIKLQNSLLSPNKKLDVGERKNFRIFFNKIYNEDEPLYYSARVYSVTE